MNNLPKNIIKFDKIRISKNEEKICTCKNSGFVIDSNNRRVYCDKCDALIDPYDALYQLATNGNELQKQVDGLLEQRKQLQEYKPWLIIIRELEKQYRGRKMIPICPSCGEPFYLEELSSWMNKEFAHDRIVKRNELK